jgi:hypothetical protein
MVLVKAVGGVVLDIAAEDKERAEESFDDEQGDGPEHGAAGAMATRGDGEGPEGQPGQQDGADAGGRTVEELDGGGEAGVVGDEVAIAERPTGATATARTAGAHDGAPENHKDEKAEDDPGESRGRLCIAFYFKYRRACHGTHSTDVLRGQDFGKVEQLRVGASSSITYNYINPLRLGGFSLMASMAHREMERTNTELFFCINLAEGRRERFG